MSGGSRVYLGLERLVYLVDCGMIRNWNFCKCVSGSVFANTFCEPSHLGNGGGIDSRIGRSGMVREIDVGILY